jgi:hypothetical protein
MIVQSIAIIAVVMVHEVCIKTHPTARIRADRVFWHALLVLWVL